jgi:hypothetical protein
LNILTHLQAGNVTRFISTIALVSAIALTFGTADAQTTITAADIELQLAPGNTLTNREDRSTDSINIGTPGATFWDFSALTSDTAQTLTSITASSTPHIADFPTATHAFAMIVNFGGITGPVYQYLRLGTDFENLGNMGSVTMPFFGTLALKTTNVPAEIVYGLPCTFGKSWTVAYTSTQVISLGEIQISTSVETHDVRYLVDAYGPMTLPGSYGTHQALRIRKIDTIQKDQDPPYTALSYAFLAKNGAQVQVTLCDTLLQSGWVSTACGALTWSAAVNDSIFVVAPPIAVTGSAQNVTGSGAELTARIWPYGATTAVKFVYGATTAYGGTTAEQTVDSAITSTFVTQAVSGLAPNTLYHFKVIGTNSAGTTSGADSTFSTPVVAPTATTLIADSVTSSMVKLTGSVNANNASTTVKFEYGTTIAYGDSIDAAESPVNGLSPVGVSANLTGLLPNTIYHFRVVAVSAGGRTNGADSTFMTPAALPTLATLSADSVTGTTAKLQGSVNPNNASTVVRFHYGTTTAYGDSIDAAESPVNGLSPVGVSANLTGLLPNTIYHFRVVAVSAGGRTNGADSTFTTLAVLPAVATLSADSVTGTTARLTGSVNPNNASTVVRFHYGTTAAYGGSIDAVESPVSGVDPVSVSAHLTGLVPSTVYHFRVVAENAGGISYGVDSTFTTLIVAPSAPSLAYPANHAADQPTSLALTWYPATTAASYRLQVSADSTFVTGFVVNDTSLTDTSRTVDGLANNIKYYWRVAAENVGGIGEWSERWDFVTIVPLPDQVVLVGPPDQSIVTADTVICVWGSARPNVTQYRFELASDSLFNSVIVDSTFSDTTLIVRSLANSSAYWWRVRAENVAGPGAFSTAWKFQVIITGVDDENGLPTEFVVRQNYPNPFNPTTTIKFGLPVEAHVTVKVYNAIGQEVLTVVDELKSAGYYRVTVDASKLPTGMYFYRVQMGDYSVAKKMLLIK